MLVEKTVQVPKETMELVQGMVNMTLAAKKALADGWQPGSDIPMIAMSAFNELLVAVQGLDQLDDEFKSAPGKLALVLGLAVDQLVGELTKKEPAPAEAPAVPA